MAAASDLPDSRGSRGTTTGVVKFYKLGQGWGAIATDATAPWDVWCHFSSIDMEGFHQLRQGQRVEVDFERRDQDSFRFVARSVRPLD